MAAVTADGAEGGNERRSRFERLFIPLLPALHSFGMRLTGRSEDAADLVQETALRAYRTFDGYTAGTNPKAWLFTILYSIFANRYHRERRRPDGVSVQEIEEQTLRRVEIPDPDAHLAILRNPGLKWGASEVDRVLAEIPESFRLAVLLVDVHELTYEEAATAAGCPVGTLRSRLFRGRLLLATALHQYAQRMGMKRG